MTAMILKTGFCSNYPESFRDFWTA